jgi:hypothetical protein
VKSGKLTVKQNNARNSFVKRHGVRDLSAIDPGEQVMVRENKTWQEGRVIGLADGSGRSYHIETEQGEYRRNRKDIQSTPQKKMLSPAEQKTSNSSRKSSSDSRAKQTRMKQRDLED